MAYYNDSEKLNYIYENIGDDDDTNNLDTIFGRLNHINNNHIVLSNDVKNLQLKMNDIEEKLDELLSILKFGPLSQIALDANEDFYSMLKDNNK